MAPAGQTQATVEAELRGKMLTALEGLAPLPDKMRDVEVSVAKLATRMDGFERQLKTAIPWWALVVTMVVGAAIGFGVSTFNRAADHVLPGAAAVVGGEAR